MNKKQFKPTKKMIDAATLVFHTMAMVQTIKPIVHAYKRKILEKHQFMGGHDKTDYRVITDPKDTWLLNDQDFKVYLDESNYEREQAGLHVDNPDHCPLLVAEHMQIKAERLLIEAMKPITKLDPDEIYDIDAYHKLVDLSLQLLAPFVKKTL